MVRIRSADEIILDAIEFYRTTQPQLDTKPGSVSRDIFVDGPSSQLARVYDELARIRTAQSFRLSLGADLDRLAQNFGAARLQGSPASGFAVFTFNNVDADIAINQGDIVTANNGATFSVTNGATVSPVNSNQLRATASRLRSDLDFVGITDQFAIEVAVQATANGVRGNISRYQLETSSTPGVSNVTNVQAFSGGSAPESDSAFRNRVLAIFSGANTGTEAGYEAAVRSDPATLDVEVVVPGDPLMTRDGTQVFIAEDGTRTIIQEGTGGKVDIYVQGLRIVEILDSYIFRDQSNRNDPTDPSNDFVLGQISGDENKTVSTRRVEDIENGVLPDQPVNDILQVSGSISGPNFIEKAVDSLGRVTGNYELIRDTGAFGGSPFGFDKIAYIDDRIRDFTEQLTKGRFNGQDPVTFPDVTRIGTITQNVQVINENSTINASNRSLIQLAHFPITSVTRVFNLTTGERYVISNQNPNGTGTLNTDGVIQISGNTLPAVSDILQVDYIWQFDFDGNFDYDNRETDANPRSVVDSIDWGFSNSVTREQAIVAQVGSQLVVTVTHPISSVINVNTFVEETGLSVVLISGRLAVVVTQAITNVVSVVRAADEAELFDTNIDDGSFSGLTVFLPTDTVAQVGDIVNVVYNANDIFTVNNVTGSFDSNQITLPSNSGVVAGTIVEVSYIANIRTLLPQTLISALPAVRNGNAFQTSTANSVGTQPVTNIFSSPGVVEQNLRQAPSRLQLVIAGNISPGVITVTGTTFTALREAVFTVSSAGLTHNLSSVIKNALNIPSTQNVPANVSVVKISKVERVQTASNLEVLSVLDTYEVKGYQIRNNQFVLDESVQDLSLSTTEFSLPASPNNVANAPSVGDRLRITFDFATTDDTENVAFSQSGSLTTQKRFALADIVSISSGFTSGPSQSATLTINNTNQPTSGNRYTTAYDYTAPKPNERISIRYNRNDVITASTFAVENTRPISADVLVKAATPLSVDVEFAVVVAPGFENSTAVVQQNVQDAITSALNSNTLGDPVDESDLINVAYSVEGVDRVRAIAFNLSDQPGRVLSIEPQENEFVQAGTVTIDIETR